MRRFMLHLAAFCVVAVPAFAWTVDSVFINGFAAEPAALAGITADHNRFRAAVGATPLLWDDRLAASAQAWANRCMDSKPPSGLIEHNPNRSKGFPWYVGENIYASGGRKASALSAVQSWASERKYYDHATNTCVAHQVCGHYMQMVWSASVRVGCGISFCPALRYSSSIVCDYAPGGNTGGKPY